ncbi:hypothetical protein KC349_g3148 [Hortaea werneckii]|nr:hypothetical protein KC349_g3148 [Hortaea werneckii]
MLLRLHRKRTVLTRLIKLLFLSLLLWSVYETSHTKSTIRNQAISAVPPFGQEKIFIASILWTDEDLLRKHWAPAIAELAREIGPERVFVSIYEGGSLDDTKAVLELLKTDLEASGIRHRIVLDETTHKDEVERSPAESGWIQMPLEKSYRQNWTDWFTLDQGTWVPRRIPYLARTRNQAMEPLYELKRAGETFDRVLWLNDVVFDGNDIRRLLATRNGDYAAACALDFKHPPSFYDFFATRDADGFEPLMARWPYFRSPASREALTRGLPVPVTSCWNGIVAFDAEPFYDVERPLAFRGIPDSLALEHLEGSECCLIHADNHLAQTKGVWINPHVRVAYNTSEYEGVSASREGDWPSSFEVMTGLWRNRFKRWLTTSSPVNQRVADKVINWFQADRSHTEPGDFCIIDEMQIMLWNGWGHA